MRTAIIFWACLASMFVTTANAGSATGPTSQPAAMVQLDVKLPKLGYDSNWYQYDRWRRERSDAEGCTEKLAPFLVPQGTQNLALRKPVTSSDMAPRYGKLELITDGYKEGIEESFVELAPGRQWVQIDLGQRYPLYAVLIWHNAAWPGLHKDVIVQLSDDQRFQRGVQTIFNNDRDNSSGLGRGTDPEYFEAVSTKIIDAHGLAARYVRLYSNGNVFDDSNRYVEVEVHGLPPAAK